MSCRTWRCLMLGISAGFGLTAAAAGVWSDAVLHIRGAVDRNSDGIWTATDYTSANAEIPDVAHAAESAPLGAKIFYAVTKHADSNVRIREESVKLSSEGRTVTRPVLYFPQPDFIDGSVNKVRVQYFKLFNGTSPITGEQWSVIFRMRPDIFMLQKKNKEGNVATSGSSWFFRFPGSGGSAEMRLGTRTKDGNKTGFLSLCTGNTTNNELATLDLTNDWIEVSMVVSNRQFRLSRGIQGRIRRWQNHTAPTGASYPTSLCPTSFMLGDCSRSAVESADYGNADAFRGSFETVGIWNRALSDAEVIEAFGGGRPGVVRLGEEGGSDKMFAGAKATGAVTLDPTDHDQRDWPASFGAGAVISVPFVVDKYRADRMQALRLVPQRGSAGGWFGVKVDGAEVGQIEAAACAADGTPAPRFLCLKSKWFAQGNHTLTLTCTSATGDVKLDVVEIVGGWQVGDGSGNDISYDSDTSWAGTTTTKPWADTYYAASANMKDNAWYLGGRATFPRHKVVYWNVPAGLASHGTFNLSYRVKNGDGASGYQPNGRNLITSVNGTTVDTRVISAKEVTVSLGLPAGTLQDGLNEIRIAIDPLAEDNIWMNPVYIKLNMTACLSDWTPGLLLFLR